MPAALAKLGEWRLARREFAREPFCLKPLERDGGRRGSPRDWY